MAFNDVLTAARAWSLLFNKRPQEGVAIGMELINPRQSFNEVCRAQAMTQAIVRGHARHEHVLVASCFDEARMNFEVKRGPMHRKLQFLTMMAMWLFFLTYFLTFFFALGCMGKCSLFLCDSPCVRP